MPISIETNGVSSHTGPLAALSQLEAGNMATNRSINPAAGDEAGDSDGESLQHRFRNRLFVGQDGRGAWVVQDELGRMGGLFRTRLDAFAKREAQACLIEVRELPGSVFGYLLCKWGA